jgi:hypothetical protein
MQILYIAKFSVPIAKQHFARISILDEQKTTVIAKQHFARISILDEQKTTVRGLMHTHVYYHPSASFFKGALSLKKMKAVSQSTLKCIKKMLIQLKMSIQTHLFVGVSIPITTYICIHMDSKLFRYGVF